MKLVINIVGVAVFLAWLCFFLRYPPRWLARWYDRVRINLPAAMRRFASAVRSIPSTILRADMRGTVRMYHTFVTDDDDPLCLMQGRYEPMPTYLYRQPTLVGRNHRATVLYWNIVYDERREEEVLWVGGPTTIQADDWWSIKIIWRRDPVRQDWLVSQWYVNGKLQFVPIPDNLFTEKCMLSNMLCAVKTAKALNSPVAR